MFTEETKNKIKDTILGYCQGITHVEFDINDIVRMIEDIEKVVKNNGALDDVMVSLDCNSCKYLDEKFDYYCDDCSTTNLLYESKQD